MGNPEYPAWICSECGEKHGRRQVNPYATWHEDTCDICGKTDLVTEPRDYGHLKDGWEQANDQA